MTNLCYENSSYADDYSDLMTKKSLFSSRVSLNSRGVALLKKSGKHPESFGHQCVSLIVSPFMDFDVNVWVFKQGSKCILIDTGADFRHLEEGLAHLSVRPTHVLITHHHPDHIGGLKGVQQAYPDLILNTLEEVEILPTPGHCEEHHSYYFPEEGICFCGDALFSLSIGRPNFSPELSLQSLHRLLSLPEDTLLFPGHGAATTVQWEREFNCFFSSGGTQFF